MQNLEGPVLTSIREGKGDLRWQNCPYAGQAPEGEKEGPSGSDLFTSISPSGLGQGREGEEGAAK